MGSLLYQVLVLDECSGVMVGLKKRDCWWWAAEHKSKETRVVTKVSLTGC